MRHFAVTVTTDSAGDGTGTIPIPTTGFLYAVGYEKVDFVNGSDVVITVEGIISKPVMTKTAVDASIVWYPRTQLHDVLGANLNYNDESDEPVAGKIPIGGESVKIVVDDGGSVKTGIYHVWIEDK